MAGLGGTEVLKLGGGVEEAGSSGALNGSSGAPTLSEANGGAMPAGTALGGSSGEPELGSGKDVARIMSGLDGDSTVAADAAIRGGEVVLAAVSSFGDVDATSCCCMMVLMAWAACRPLMPPPMPPPPLSECSGLKDGMEMGRGGSGSRNGEVLKLFAGVGVERIKLLTGVTCC